ncbi:MAG: MFS transporter [Alphaproteobacteria bacterium]|jgi:EmrB/QacA subfamily drug resistance transporter|nr:MFS transporter [Alphaproteobacteria bacterium]MBP9878442.1 MFS transporter [Alphaproteobacteria bacterium]
MTKSISSFQSFWILFSLSVLVFLINVDYTAVNLALVSIAADMEAPLNTVQWVLSAYVLSWGAFVVLAGKMADIYGKRRILLYGVWIFVIASAIIGLSADPYILIAGRVLQGIGGALFVPPIYSLVFMTAPPEKQGFVIGVLGGAAGLGLATGPSFGGLILSYLGWDWIFFVNIPLGLIVIAVILLVVDKEPKLVSENKVDHVGAGLLAIGLVFLMIAFNQAEAWGIDSVYLYVLMAFGFGALYLFGKQQRGKAEQMIPFSFFKNKTYLGCVGGVFVFELIFSSFIVLMGLYLQNILDYDAKIAGYIFLSMTLSFGLFSPLGGKLVDLVDGRIPLVGGMLLLFAGLSITLFFDGSSSLTQIISAFLLVGLGFGLSLSPVNAIMMQSVDEKDVSTAAGIFAMSALVGCTIGVIFASSLLTGLARGFLTQSLVSADFVLSSEQTRTLFTVATSARYSPEHLTGFPLEILPKVLQLIDGSFLHAMSYVQMASMVLALLGALGSYYFIRVKPKKPKAA